MTAIDANPESRAPSPGTLPLLIEIGCEEIPARFLAGAQKDFGERLQAALTQASLSLGTVGKQSLQTYSTPRRLVAYVPEVFGTQSDKVEEVRGPAFKVAYDPQGRPTRAAESFAAKNGATLQDLIKVATSKGEYVAVRKPIAGRSALEVLPEILPHVVAGLSFTKSMVWERSKTRFIRPIRWILALLGEDAEARLVPFEICGMRSGNQTYGHRTLGPGPVDVCGFGDYAAKLHSLGVEFDPEVRRQWVRLALQWLPKSSGWPAIREVLRARSKPLQQTDPDERLEELRSRVKVLPQAPSLQVVEDKELEEWVVNSTECPRALMGSFEERFLQLPREILVTVMRDHEKCFAMEDGAGNLQPKFVASVNLDSDPEGYIRAGHERVLAARFSDAEFFWKADQRIALSDRLPMLERVTYQVKLGSYGDKVRRMEAIATRICCTLAEQGKISATDTDHVLRAVRLSKCDLTTQMVQEFTELQGVVGGLYAKVQGEPPEVAEAIYDHYLPQGAEDRCPRSLVGAVVSLADKIDIVAAGFAVGLEPTGSSDPFGLRRAGNAVVRLAVEMLPGIDLQKLLPDEFHEKTCHFLRERVEHYLQTHTGFRYDTVRAVTRESLRSWNVPSDAARRAAALEKIKDTEDFLALAAAAKRTRNILEKSAESSDFGESTDIDVGMLTPGAERDLYEGYQRMRNRLKSFDENGDYEAEFRALGTLRPLVDRFFDEVLVMDENKENRARRLALLAGLRAWVFQRFADLSQIGSSG